MRTSTRLAFSRKRYEAKRIGVAFTLHYDDVEFADSCPYCGGEVSWSAGRGRQRPDSGSFDRIDPSVGYVPANTITVCTGCNRQKSNLTPDEWNAVLGVRRKKGQIN